MASVARIAKIRFDNGLGSFREWVATAAVSGVGSDFYNPGETVNVTITQTSGGAAPPGVADTLELRIRANDWSGPAYRTIRTITLTPGSASQSTSFAVTLNGVAGDTPGWGYLMMDLYVRRTTVPTYEYDSWGGGVQTPPTGFTGPDTRSDRGQISTRVDVVNIANKTSHADPAYTGTYAALDTIFHRAIVYIPGTSTVAFPLNDVEVRMAIGTFSPLSNFDAQTVTPASTSSAYVERTYSVTDAYPAAATPYDVYVTTLQVPGVSSPTIIVSQTVQSFTVDPRVTAQQHLQIDDNSFGTAKNEPLKSMLSTQSGFIWVILKNARDEGLNGLTVSQTLTPVAPGTAINNSTTTTTQDSQAGVSGRLDWTASKPGGTWNKATDVTAPSTVDANTHLVGGTDALTLLAPDPRIRVLVGAGPYGTSADEDHWHPGDPLLVGLAVQNNVTRKLVTVDASPAPTMQVGRFNQTLGRAEYLDSDLTWKAAGEDATSYAWPLAQSLGDAQTWILVFADTSGFSHAGLFFIALAYVGGTPYSGPAFLDPVSKLANTHPSFAVDSIGLALTGKLSMR